MYVCMGMHITWYVCTMMYLCYMYVRMYAWTDGWMKMMSIQMNACRAIVCVICLLYVVRAMA